MVGYVASPLRLEADCLSAGVEPGTVDALGFDGFEHRLDDRVIVTIPFPTHRRDHPVAT